MIPVGVGGVSETRPRGLLSVRCLAERAIVELEGADALGA